MARKAEVQESRSQRRRRKWREDAAFRERELARAKAERAARRAAAAPRKFREMVAAGRKRSVPTRRPRMWSPTGKTSDLVEVYPTGTFSVVIARTGDTIRDWMKRGVLPGASVWYGVGVGRKAYFTQGYMNAVFAAMARVYAVDGNGRLEILRRFIVEELERAGEVVSPAPGGSDG